MSGRSAYVRKKITETHKGGDRPRGRSKSTASSSAGGDDATISDLPIPSNINTGVGTTTARFLKFPEPAARDTADAVVALASVDRAASRLDRDMGYGGYRGDMGGFGGGGSSLSAGGSQSGGSMDDSRLADGTGGYGLSGSGRGGVMRSDSQFRDRPLEDFAYARARKPTIRTEDVSGIEKSGLRSAIDKKSEEVRKGLAKTFAFRKKGKSSSYDKQAADFRPQSAATVRPGQGSAGHDGTGRYMDDYDPYGDSIPPHIFPGQGADPWDTLASPPLSARFPPAGGAGGLPPIKRWIGAGRPVQRWNKLRKDPELWDPNGDVLVFFGHRGQTPRPNPSFRLSSHIIEATESRYLIELLREGSTEEDIHMPPSPIGAPPMLRGYGGGSGMGGGHLHAGGHLVAHGGHGGNVGNGGNGGQYGRGGQPTPPISEDASLAEADGQISYEMYFPTPPGLSKLDALRHSLTTRNVFALLYHASLVGLSLYQALSDLHARLESYMPPDSDNVGTILNYLSARGIDDVRSDAETAVSLLAWSEGSEVRWEEGWRESFLHCAGMYSRLEAAADFRNVTPITRALLERASLETQLRVQAAEERLAEFAYADMWPAGSATSPARQAADRLQKFLIQHYARVFNGRWPPPPPPPHHSVASAQYGRMPGERSGSTGDVGGKDGEASEEIWLTRTVAQQLQRDFGALYDYLVNRDIVWDGSETRPGRKWIMVSESGNRAFEADSRDLPMTDMLIEFDNKLRFPHIPHPYPLVPESIPPANASSAGGNGGNGMFKSNSKKNLAAAAAMGGSASGGSSSSVGGPGRAGALERRVQLAYTEATNIYILGSDFTASDLIDAFVKFEKTDRIGEVDPAVARRGRWVLIYGILQTLASVSVDAPTARYRDDVPYHLSPRLKGTKLPPWRGAVTARGGQDEEACHELSHCWLAPLTWGRPGQGGKDSGTSGGNTSGSGEPGSASNTSGGEDSGGSAGNSPIMAGHHTYYHAGGQYQQQYSMHGGGMVPGGLSLGSAAGSGRHRAGPPTVASSVRSSTMGYHTPAGARSVCSSGSVAGDNPVGGGPALMTAHQQAMLAQHQQQQQYQLQQMQQQQTQSYRSHPPLSYINQTSSQFGSAMSVSGVSESDTASSSARTPASTSRRVRSKDNLRSGAGSMRSQATFGGGGRTASGYNDNASVASGWAGGNGNRRAGTVIDEADWPVRGPSFFGPPEQPVPQGSLPAAPCTATTTSGNTASAVTAPLVIRKAGGKTPSPPPATSTSQPATSGASAPGTTSKTTGSSTIMVAPLTIPGSVTGTGGFLDDDAVVGSAGLGAGLSAGGLGGDDSRRGSFSTAVSGSGTDDVVGGSAGSSAMRSAKSRERGGQPGSRKGTPPVIRDFDELDVIHDHEP